MELRGMSINLYIELVNYLGGEYQKGWNTKSTSKSEEIGKKTKLPSHGPYCLTNKNHET